MNVEEMIIKLKAARAMVAEISAGSDIPQMRSILRHADHNLHWALWNLGEVDGLIPEIERDI